MLTEGATSALDKICDAALVERRKRIGEYVLQIQDRTKTDSRKVSTAEIAGAIGVHVRQRANTIDSWKMGQIKRASDRHVTLMRMLAKGHLVLVDTGELLPPPKNGSVSRRRLFKVDVPARKRDRTKGPKK